MLQDCFLLKFLHNKLFLLFDWRSIQWAFSDSLYFSKHFYNWIEEIHLSRRIEFKNGNNKNESENKRFYDLEKALHSPHVIIAHNRVVYHLIILFLMQNTK